MSAQPTESPATAISEELAAGTASVRRTPSLQDSEDEEPLVTVQEQARVAKEQARVVKEQLYAHEQARLVQERVHAQEQERLAQEQARLAQEQARLAQEQEDELHVRQRARSYLDQERARFAQEQEKERLAQEQEKELLAEEQAARDVDESRLLEDRENAVPALAETLTPQGTPTMKREEPVVKREIDQEQQHVKTLLGPPPEPEPRPQEATPGTTVPGTPLMPPTRIPIAPPSPSPSLGFINAVQAELNADRLGDIKTDARHLEEDAAKGVAAIEQAVQAQRREKPLVKPMAVDDANWKAMLQQAVDDQDFVAREKLDQRFRRQHKKGTPAYADFKKQHSLEDKHKFKMKWVTDSMTLLSEKYEVNEQWQEITTEKGVYHPFMRIVQEEGSDASALQAAWRYCKKCSTMGGKWRAWNPMTERWEYLWVKKYHIESFSRSWTHIMDFAKNAQTASIGGQAVGAAPGQDFGEARGHALRAALGGQTVGAALGGGQALGAASGGQALGAASGEQAASTGTAPPALPTMADLVDNFCGGGAQDKNLQNDLAFPVGPPLARAPRGEPQLAQTPTPIQTPTLAQTPTPVQAPEAAKPTAASQTREAAETPAAGGGVAAKRRKLTVKGAEAGGDTQASRPPVDVPAPAAAADAAPAQLTLKQVVEQAQAIKKDYIQYMVSAANLSATINLEESWLWAKNPENRGRLEAALEEMKRAFRTDYQCILNMSTGQLKKEFDETRLKTLCQEFVRVMEAPVNKLRDQRETLLARHRASLKK